METLRLLTAALLLAPAGASQFTLFDWRLAGEVDGYATLSESLMEVHGGYRDPIGNFMAFKTQMPVAGLLSLDLNYTDFDGSCGLSVPASSLNGTIQDLLDCSGHSVALLEVGAGDEVGFGVHTYVPSWPGISHWTDITFTPRPTQVNGQESLDRFGWSLALTPDVDADGAPDLLVGAPGPETGVGSTGGVAIVSGADGTVPLTVDGKTTDDDFGFAVASAGDVDGDGLGDALVGSPEADTTFMDTGRAVLVSAADGSELADFPGSVPTERFGHAVAGPGDLDGDGVADVFIGAPFASPQGLQSGRAVAISSATGAVLFEIEGTTTAAWLGYSVAAAGDVDADGVGDLVIGAPFDTSTGEPAGSVQIVSGVTGAPIHAFDGDDDGDEFGWSVAAAGDVDADGFPDVLIGAPEDFRGAAFVVSGRTGKPILTSENPSEDSNYGDYGFAVAGAGDVDGDGYADLLAAVRDDLECCTYFPGAVFVTSGRTGDVLFLLRGAGWADMFGSALAGAGDPDGDGLSEIVLGAPGLDQSATDAGAIQLYDFFVPWKWLGHGLAGTTGEPALEAVGLLYGDTPVTLTLIDAKPLALVTLVIGFSSIDAPFKGGTLVPSPDVAFAGLLTDLFGTLELQGTWPAGVPSGLSVYVQAWTGDAAGPHGFTASNALVGTTP